MSTNSAKKQETHDLEYLSFLNSRSHNFLEIWEAQKDRLEKVASGKAPEAIIFCEHEKLITTGRRFREGNILGNDIPVYAIERGGDVTYHGPGQIVIYPILKLNGPLFPKGLHEYLRFLEQIIIDSLDFIFKGSIQIGRFGPTGVWVRRPKTGETKKIASIGVAVKRWVTYHGVALNVSTDLNDFAKIRPCDFESSVMTSIQEEGVKIGLMEVASIIQSRIEMELSHFEREGPLRILGGGADLLKRTANF